MGRQKRAIGAVLLLCLCIAGMGACGKKEGKMPQKEEGFCKDISFFDCLGQVSFCDKGLLRIENGLMIFYEYNTGKSYPLCSNAYCSHVPYDEVNNPDPVCEATLESLVFACIYGENLYTFQETGWQEIRVQKRNLKKSGYQVVAELPYCKAFSAQGYDAVRDGKAYLFFGGFDKELEEWEILGGYTANDLYTELVELDLETGKYKTLFCIGEDTRYQLLRTFYAKDGIYMQWYYEDNYYDPEAMRSRLNEYWEKFYYVSYDGSEKRELCPEVSAQTVFYGENPEKSIMVPAIGEQGVYVPIIWENRLELHTYGNEIEKVYEQPSEQEILTYVLLSGNCLLTAAKVPEGGYRVVGTDVTTKKTLEKEPQEAFGYIPVQEGVFKNFVWHEDGAYMEFWKWEDIFSEKGTPFLTVKQ